MKNIKHVRFVDYSGYDPDKCNNGGCYGFWTDYHRLPDGNFEVSYGTTADFEFCPACGSFGNHVEYDAETDEEIFSCTCGSFEIITEEELEQLIDNFVETDDCYIDITQTDF